MNGKAVRIGIGGRTRGIEQDEHAEIARKFAAFQVDVFRRRVAGAQIDEQVDERLEVELVTIGTAAKTLGPRPTRAKRRRSTSSCGTPAAGCRPRRSCGKSMTRHHSRTVPVVVYVPLRIEGAAHADGSAGLAVVGEMDPGGQWPGVRPDGVRPPNRPNRHLGTGGAVSGRTRVAEQLAEEVRRGVSS